MMHKVKAILTFILCGFLFNGQAIADATLIHQYTFSDDWITNNFVEDSIGNSNGTIVNGVTRVTNSDFFGTGASCTTARFGTGYIELNNLGLNTADNAITSVTFWMKWDGNANDMPFSWNRYDLWFSNNKFGFNSFNNNVYGIASSTVTNNNNDLWVHVAAVFKNKDMGYNKLYINGIAQTLGGNGDISNVNSVVLQTLAIGGHANSNNSYSFEGDIGNFRVWVDEITQTQVTADMQNINAACQLIIPEPTVEYHFDNITTNNVIDFSGNNNDGTAFSISTTEGLLCEAADFSATGTADYIVANHNALNGLSDFTAMAWVKTNQTSDATIFSAGSSNSGLGTNEATFFIDDTQRFWPTITAAPFNTSTRLVTINNINNSLWHQIVWTRNASIKQSCFFFDGLAQGCVIHNDGDDVSPIDVIAGGLILGQEQDSLGGSFDANQAFNGLMDEFMIFNTILDDAKISEINQNIRSQKNWDGTPRVCTVIEPILDMRFDEASWSGTNSVLDDSGNDYHGTPFGSAQPIAGKSCNAVNLRQTGIADYISVNSEAINGLDDFSVVFWGKQEATNTMSALSGAGSNSNSLLLFFLPNNPATGNLSIKPHLNNSTALINSIFDNDWHQFAWTRNANTTQNCIYRDGQLVGCANIGDTAALNIAVNGFVIGQEQDSVGGGFDETQAWNGLIDELLIFPTVLTQADIQKYQQYTIDNKDWQGNAKSCLSTIDHYRFEIPASTGLTCVASDIVLKACTDAACLATSTVSSSLTLSPVGLWSLGGIISDDITFTGSTNLQLSQPNAELTAISASGLNPTPSSTPAVLCTGGTSANNCGVLFKDTGFLFSNIPHQISNKLSSLEFNGQPLSIQAVEKNTTTGACQAIFPDGDDINIELKLNCVSGSCSDIAVTTDSSGTPVQVSSSFSNVPFNFGANSEASYELNYADAGELSLSAKKVVTLDSGATETLEGISNSFVVKPFGFRFEFPVGIDPFSDGLPTGDFTVFTNAGEDFAVNVIAIGWQAGEDKDNVGDVFDGNISALFNANNNPDVKFFMGESVKLSHQLQLPSGGVVGSFTASNASLPSLAVNANPRSMASFTNARWSEVGVMSLQAKLVPDVGQATGQYLGTSDVVGYISNVGRFTPHHFDFTNVTPGELTGQCSNQTFIGELVAGGAGALTYGALNPMVTIVATNKQGGTTLNYRDAFARFDTLDATFSAPENGELASALSLTGVVNVGAIAQKLNGFVPAYGQFIYTATDSDNFIYTRNLIAKVSPFPANIKYTVATFKDQDQIGLAAGSLLTLTAVSSATPLHQMMYGRVTLTNTFGPETDSLAMPVEHQLFDGTQFVINTNIGVGCVTPVFPNTDFTLLPATLGDLNQAALPSSSAWLAGHANLLIPPPNTVQGSVEFTLDVPAWLMFDWDNLPATPDTNPNATATFGRYRGNDRIINWRERR
jgi:MSHA biogenesis protein MshQ